MRTAVRAVLFRIERAGQSPRKGIDSGRFRVNHEQHF